MAIIIIGINLAKNVFAVHGVDEQGKPALVWPKVPRADLAARVGRMALAASGTTHQSN